MKKLTAFLPVLVFVLFFAATAHAASSAPLIGGGEDSFVDPNTDVGSIPSLVITYLQYLAIVLAIV